MKLADVFESLALGELSGSSYTELNGYELIPNQLPKVINAINQGMTFIHTQLPIKHNQILLQITDGIGTYYLDKRYAVSNENSDSLVRYILDTKERPFKEDILNIVGVFSLEGHQYPLNDQYAIGSLFTPDFNSISVPLAMWLDHTKPNNAVDKLVILYQANHEKIPLTEPLDSNFTINLSPTYLAILYAYVAHLLFMQIGTPEGVNQSNTYFAKFNTLIETAKEQGIGVITQTGVNIKPLLRGYL